MFTSRKKFWQKKGFTLLETLIALALGAVVSLVIVMTVSAGLKSIRGANETERLHSDSTFIANALTYWVKQSRAMETPDLTTLNLTLYDSSVKSFALDGVDLELDGARINTEDSEVADIKFTKLARSVRVSFTLRSPDSGLTFSATSTVAQRN